MKKHSTKILQIASLVASRESGFLFAVCGVIIQMCHTWFIAYDLSSLPGIWKFAQAGLMAFFISAALLFFVLKSTDDNNPKAKQWRKTVTMFAWLETCINLYYWGHKLLWLAWPDPDYGSFIIAIPFSFVIPLTLKAYSREVRVEDYSDVDEQEDIKISSNRTTLTEEETQRICSVVIDMMLGDESVKMKIAENHKEIPEPEPEHVLQEIHEPEPEIHEPEPEIHEPEPEIHEPEPEIHEHEHEPEIHEPEPELQEIHEHVLQEIHEPEPELQEIHEPEPEPELQEIHEPEHVLQEIHEPEPEPELQEIHEPKRSLEPKTVNGSYETCPSYVEPAKEISEEEKLFNYSK